jgi:hypothetical protein
MARRSRAAAALLACALVAGCASGAGTPPDPAPTPSSTSGTPTGPAGPAAADDVEALEAAEVEAPPPAPRSQTENDLVRLAALAERIAGRLPQQVRPANLVVEGASVAWQPGASYRGYFADPDVARVGDRFYAYATNTSRRHVPVLTSTDLRSWTALAPDALPAVGDWVQNRDRGGGLWAPGIERIGDGWTLAYSAQLGVVGGERHNCIGLARGDSPTGPFRHLGDPVACASTSPQGVIDPDLYTDPDGRAWMLWKFSSDPGRLTAIFSRQLNRDGTGWARGSQTYEILTHQPGGWEGGTIENPSMITFRGATYLFYSANRYTTEAYATGYAICEGPAGPCGRPSPLPLLDTGSTGHLGPGGASAFEHDGSLRLAYHAWEPGQVDRLRRLRVAGLWQRPDLTLELVNAG